MGYDSSPYGAFVDASYFTKLSQFACQFYDSYSVTISHIMLLLKERFILSRPFLSYIVFACMPLPLQLLVRAHLVHRNYSKSSSVSKYLVLVYERCINSLLLADSIPSNSDHLFWNKSMEFIECLETWSHQWKILFSLLVLRIHQCPMVDRFFHVFDLNTYIHTCFIALCTLIPIFIICGISRIC